MVVAGEVDRVRSRVTRYRELLFGIRYADLNFLDFFREVPFLRFRGLLDSFGYRFLSSCLPFPFVLLEVGPLRVHGS